MVKRAVAGAAHRTTQEVERRSEEGRVPAGRLMEKAVTASLAGSLRAMEVAHRL